MDCENFSRYNSAIFSFTTCHSRRLHAARGAGLLYRIPEKLVRPARGFWLGRVFVPKQPNFYVLPTEAAAMLQVCISLALRSAGVVTRAAGRICRGVPLLPAGTQAAAW
jgi:hypothetical protein